MDSGLSFKFERSLYQAVVRFKREHPGVLEEITRQRKAREAQEAKNGCHGSGKPKASA